MNVAVQADRVLMSLNNLDTKDTGINDERKWSRY
jgi:hypothetical protein